MTEHDRRALRPYKKILAAARKKLNINTPFSLTAGDKWYFDVPRNRAYFNLMCPPFSADAEASFLHYLCHAHILDAGWLLPITETKGIGKKAFFYSVNRPIDHFFDYYAWLLVIEKFSAKYPLRASSDVASATSERIIRGLKIIREQFKSPYPAYTTAIDWFSLFPTIASFINKAREARILALFHKVRSVPDFEKTTLRGTARRIDEIQAFFRELLREYPRYDLLLSDKEKFKRQYTAYYTLVWREMPLESRIVDFY